MELLIFLCDVAMGCILGVLFGTQAYRGIRRRQGMDR